MTKNNDIIAIGNAIVDIICEVDDLYLKNRNLIKGSMSLIHEKGAIELSELNHQKIISGGSAANTIATISKLGQKCEFIGKVSDDRFGKKFISQMQEIGVNYVSKQYSDQQSAKSFILITPDKERTMCTFLGCAGEIEEEDIAKDNIANSKILYLEGYLWDNNKTINSLKKAINIAQENNTKIAFTLSDSFCVSRHKNDFINLIKNDLDILFANEEEIKEIVGLNNIEENNYENLHQFFHNNKKLTAAITRGEKGCVIFKNNHHYEIKCDPVNKIVDLTGAGDAFAAGFLSGLIANYDLEKSAKIGNELGAKIIQKFGARFDNNEI